MTYHQQSEVKRQMTYRNGMGDSRPYRYRVVYIFPFLFIIGNSRMTIGNINFTRTHPHTHTHSASMIENMQLFLDNIMVGQVMKWLRLHTHLHWILQFVDMLHVIEIYITFCLFFVRFLRPFINLSIYLFLIVSAQVAPAFIEHKHLICFCNYKWHMHTHIKQWINSPSDCDEHACHTYFYTSLFITILHTFLFFFPPCTEQFLSLHFNKKIGFSRYNDCNPWQNMQFWLVCLFVCLVFLLFNKKNAFTLNCHYYNGTLQYLILYTHNKKKLTINELIV